MIVSSIFWLLPVKIEESQLLYRTWWHFDDDRLKILRKNTATVDIIHYTTQWTSDLQSGINPGTLKHMNKKFVVEKERRNIRSERGQDGPAALYEYPCNLTVQSTLPVVCPSPRGHVTPSQHLIGSLLFWRESERWWLVTHGRSFFLQLTHG